MWLRCAAVLLALTFGIGADPTLGSSAPVDADQIGAWQSEPLHIATADGDIVFHVEIAADADTQRRGLMFREKLEADAGMLFLFGMDARRSFWMHNTLISLDLVFIRSDGTIAAIVEDATPKSNEIISPVEFAASVLEINAGTARARGIAVGDKVSHPALKAFVDGLP